MNRRLVDLEHRRQRLIMEAAAQREAVAQVYRRWRVPAAIADGVLTVGRFFRHQPLALAGVVAAFVALRRIDFTWVTTRGAILWRVYRTYRSFRGRLGV